jgi:predicted Zn-dependent protease
MKITPHEPDHSVNAKPYSQIIEFGWLTAAFITAGFAIYGILGLVVDQIASWIPQRYEAKIFPRAASQIFASTGDAHKKDTRLQALLERLVAASSRIELPLYARTLDSDQPNAFALPGGGIFVSTGLLRSSESENEVAMVVAHEMGHFVHRHHLRGLGRGILWAVLSALVGGSSDDLSLFNASLSLSHLGHSRKQEEDADAFALELVNLTYGHVNGAARFFERMTAEDPSLAAAQYFSTHPLSRERVDRLHALATEKGFKVDGPLTPYSFVAENSTSEP